MNKPSADSGTNSSTQHLAACLELARSEFMRWLQLQSGRRAQQLQSELHRESLTSLGRAGIRLRLRKQWLAEDVRERIIIYERVALQHNSPEMLSDEELERFESRIMTTLSLSVPALQKQNDQDINSSGDTPPSGAVEAAQKRAKLELEVAAGDVLSAEMIVLRAKRDANCAADAPKVEDAALSQPQAMLEGGDNASPLPQSPEQASWLKDRLLERSKTETAAHLGPQGPTEYTRSPDAEAAIQAGAVTVANATNSPVPTSSAGVSTLAALEQKPGTNRRKRKPDPTVQRLKDKVRKLRKEGLDYKSICGRMGCDDRPPRSTWRDFSWPVAYRKRTSAVTKWLSEACS